MGHLSMKILFCHVNKKISSHNNKTVAKSVDLRLLCYALMRSALNDLTLASGLPKS